MNMKHYRRLQLLLVMFSTATFGMAQTDSTKVQNDSITWNKELEGVTVKAQRQLIKQDIDRIGYDVQADEVSRPMKSQKHKPYSTCYARCRW